MQSRSWDTPPPFGGRDEPRHVPCRVRGEEGGQGSAGDGGAAG